MPDLFAPEHRSGNIKFVSGSTTTVTASDTVATGLAKVIGAMANLDSDPVLTAGHATAHAGNQAGAPPAGFILVKTWMPTTTSSTALIAATTFGKIVNWLAWGY